MEGPLVKLVVTEQRLGELLARPQSGEHDVRSAWSGSDQPSGNVDNAHLLAHVQDKDLAGPADDGSLKHQLHGLMRRHEVPAHVGVGDCHRSAGRHLRAE